MKYSNWTQIGRVAGILIGGVDSLGKEQVDMRMKHPAKEYTISFYGGDNDISHTVFQTM